MKNTLLYCKIQLLLLVILLCSNLVAQNNIRDFRSALLPVKSESIFKMPGYYLWDPSVVEVDGIYHLFASRWPEADGGEGWIRSEIIRATSKSLWGPYTFQEVVMSPKGHTWATKGCHNPKIVRLKDRFLLYYLGIPAWKTGFAFSKSIEGPWEVLPQPSIPTNNPAIVVKQDGSVYAVGKYLIRKPGEKESTKFMQAFEAKSVTSPFTLLKDSANRLPNNCELEDPTIWISKNGYNIICTDWQARATGVWKGLIYFSSKDGIDYQLNSTKPIWDRNEPLPMADGTDLRLTKVERPQVYTDKKGKVTALLVAAEPKPKGASFIIIRPVDNYSPY